MAGNIVSLEIARRYLFAKKSQNAINIISAISAIGVMVATAALIIVLSVFNGLNGLVTGLFGSFDPDLKIVPAQGKSLCADSLFCSVLNAQEDIAAWAMVIEDNALVRYGRRQMPSIVMGVAANYNNVTSIDTIIVEGCFRPNRCLLGIGLADRLGVSSMALSPYIVFYAPRRVGKINMQNPESSFVERTAAVSGIFMVQQSDYDYNYVIADINMARNLFGYDEQTATSICVRLADGAKTDFVARQLESKLGSGVIVKDKWQQHAGFFRMMEVEKLMGFFILLFIVLIAAFNIIGSLSMLIFEKKESIGVLRSLGADRQMVTKIFLFEGWMVSVGGVLLGLLIGILMVLAQQQWGIVGFGGDDSYIISAYPVSLQWSDVGIVFVSVVLLAIFAAYYPVRSIVSRYYSSAK